MTAPPLILVVAEREELDSEESFYEIFKDFAGGRWNLKGASVMDAYMTALPAKVALTILSLGRLAPLHLELLDRIREETGSPVLVHLTDDHPEARRQLDTRPGVVSLKKPASLHQMAEAVERLLAEGAPPPLSPGAAIT